MEYISSFYAPHLKFITFYHKITLQNIRFIFTVCIVIWHNEKQACSTEKHLIQVTIIAILRSLHLAYKVY